MKGKVSGNTLRRTPLSRGPKCRAFYSAQPPPDMPPRTRGLERGTVNKSKTELRKAQSLFESRCLMALHGARSTGARKVNMLFFLLVWSMA